MEYVPWVYALMVEIHKKALIAEYYVKDPVIVEVWSLGTDPPRNVCVPTIMPVWWADFSLDDVN